MHAKRRASAAGSAGKRSRTRSSHTTATDAAASGLTISALPTDVLALVFEYTPLLARLRALSFVCKRWRTAALRSVHHISYFRHYRKDFVHDAAYRLVRSAPYADISLYPALTSVKCMESLCFQSLPAALTKLSLDLGGNCIDWLMEREQADQPTFFTALFPHLTAFKFDTHYSTPLRRAEYLSHLSVFIIRHSATLRTLKLPLHEPPLPNEFSFSVLLIALSRFKVFAGLHTLALPSLDDVTPLREVLSGAPQLRSLYLRLEDGSSLFDLPRDLLTPLTRVGLFGMRSFTPAQAEFLASLPNLREVYGEVKAFPKAIKHTNTMMTLRKGVHWATLRQYPNLDSLTINQVRSDITPLPFTRLRTVHVNVAAPLSFLLEVLRLCRGVRRFTAALAGADEAEVCAGIAALWSEAARSNVRALEVQIGCKFDEETMVPPAAAHGWMELVVRYGKGGYYCNMKWN